MHRRWRQPVKFTLVFGPGALQDIDLASAFEAVALFSQMVLNTPIHSELMSLANRSTHVEQDEAHLIFPDDVQTLPSDAAAQGPAGRIGRWDVCLDARDTDTVVVMTNYARRPCIVLGHGAPELVAESIQRWAI